MWHFWLRVREEGAESERTLAFADDQLRRIPQQLQLAACVLGQHGAFTEYGQAIFDGIRRGAEEINSQAKALFPQDVPAWTLNEQGATVRQRSRETRQLFTVRQAIADHLERYERSRKNGFPVELELATA